MLGFFHLKASGLETRPIAEGTAKVDYLKNFRNNPNVFGNSSRGI